MALSIVVYHYTAWMRLEEYSVFMRFYGRYGVSIFYLLSGFTMSLIYSDRIEKYEDVRNFLIKRFKRIYPLLFFTSIATFIGLKLSGVVIEWGDLLQSVFLVFPFFKWWSPIARGAWSIGNEVVFYLGFVFLQYVFKARFNAVIVALLVFSFLFSIFTINDQLPLTERNWINYTNPISQMKFFIMGILTHKMNHYDAFKLLSKFKWLLLVLGLLFSYTTVVEYNIVSGYIGVIGLFLSLLIFFSFVSDANNEKDSRYLMYLGTISYSIYLIHPLVYSLYKKSVLFVSFNLIPSLELILLIAFTVVVSKMSYKSIEDKFR